MSNQEITSWHVMWKFSFDADVCGRYNAFKKMDVRHILTIAKLKKITDKNLVEQTMRYGVLYYLSSTIICYFLGLELSRFSRR